MKIEEAIEKNRDLIDELVRDDYLRGRDREALILGIEALERIKMIRVVPYIEWLRSVTEIRGRLPSEGE